MFYPLIDRVVYTYMNILQVQNQTKSGLSHRELQKHMLGNELYHVLQINYKYGYPYGYKHGSNKYVNPNLKDDLNHKLHVFFRKQHTSSSYGLTPEILPKHPLVKSLQLFAITDNVDDVMLHIQGMNQEQKQAVYTDWKDTILASRHKDTLLYALLQQETQVENNHQDILRQQISSLQVDVRVTPTLHFVENVVQAYNATHKIMLLKYLELVIINTNVIRDNVITREQLEATIDKLLDTHARDVLQQILREQPTEEKEMKEPKEQEHPETKHPETKEEIGESHEIEPEDNQESEPPSKVKQPREDTTEDDANMTVQTRSKRRKQHLDKHNKHTVAMKINEFDLTEEDLERLQPEGWLNDELINAFVSTLTPAKGTKHMLTYFIPELQRDYNPVTKVWHPDKLRSYERRWKKLQEQSINRFLIPVNVKSNHWILMEVDLTTKQILFYDSIPNYMSLHELETLVETTIIPFLRLNKTYQTISIHDLQIIQAPTPVQSNTYDCGIHVLLNFERRSQHEELPHLYTKQQLNRKEILTRLQQADELGKTK